MQVANAATTRRGIQLFSFGMTLSLQGVAAVNHGNPA
jgi:hypothetical protein